MIEILYEDRDMVVCVKPVGLDSEHGMPQALTQQLSGDFFTLHRLDQNVGGVMVYARNKPAAARLTNAISEKEYVAMVHGTPPETGDWEDLLFKDSRKNKVFVVKRQRSGVKPARLTYTRMTAAQRSLVRIRLYTGRSHQIRAQFSSRGYPLVGDHKYGSRAEETAPLLFSCKLTIDGRSFEALPAWAEEV